MTTTLGSWSISRILSNWRFGVQPKNSADRSLHDISRGCERSLFNTFQRMRIWTNSSVSILKLRNCSQNSWTTIKCSPLRSIRITLGVFQFYAMHHQQIIPKKSLGLVVLPNSRSCNLTTAVVQSPQPSENWPKPIHSSSSVLHTEYWT